MDSRSDDAAANRLADLLIGQRQGAREEEMNKRLDEAVVEGNVST